MDLHFRPVVQKDLAKFPVWYKRIDGSKLFTHFIPKTFISFDESKDLLWLIILLDEEEIGTIWFERKDQNKDAYDLGIYLNRVEFFGKKIGKHAIQLAIDHILARKNVKELFLDVRNENIRAIRCYASLGFETIDEKEKSTESGIIRFKRMRLLLSPPNANEKEES